MVRKLATNRPTQPIAWALFDRTTGEMVGTPAAIAKSDFPFMYVPPQEKLWRYMDFFKFQDMLSTGTLYMTRGDQYSDPYEGRLSSGNLTSMSESEKAFRKSYPMKENPEERAAQIERHRTTVYISCWHRNKKESLEMWNAYTTSNDSVVVMTSVKTMQTHLPARFLKYGVRYHGNDFPRTELSHNALYYYKPDSYQFEHEFRILRFLDETEVTDPDAKFARVAIRLNRILKVVVAHPQATQSFKQEVGRLLRLHCPALQLKNSAFQP